MCAWRGRCIRIHELTGLVHRVSYAPAECIYLWKCGQPRPCHIWSLAPTGCYLLCETSVGLMSPDWVRFLSGMSSLAGYSAVDIVVSVSDFRLLNLEKQYTKQPIAIMCS